MTGCAPTVAQALLPFPQYCNNITSLDENPGSSTYHPFQLKAEHRFSNGLWALLSYTNSKLITNADNTENIFNPTCFSPFEIGRNRSLAIEDVPQALNIASSHELPPNRAQCPKKAFRTPSVNQRLPAASERSMRRSGHPSRPRAITCCFFASFKTLLISTKATCLTPKSTSRASFSLAGFQVTHIGRFWVTPEAPKPASTCCAHVALNLPRVKLQTS
jgi:hypothetical protein